MGQSVEVQLTGERVRTHVVLSREAVDEMDKVVGKRGRSAFIDEAVRQRLQRERFLRVLDQTFGAVRDEDHPEFADVPRLVRERRQSGERLEQLGIR